MPQLRRTLLIVGIVLLAAPAVAQQTIDATVIEHARELADRGAYGQSLAVLDGIGQAAMLQQRDRRAIATLRAESLLGQGRFQEATAPARAALEASTGLSQAERADTLLLVSRVALSGGAPSADALEQALKAAVEADGPDSLRALRVRDRIALSQSASRASDAEQTMREVIAKAESASGEVARDKLRFLNTLGIALLRQSKFEAAKEVLSLAYQRRLALLSKTHPETLESEHNLGFAYRRLGNTRQADILLGDVLALRSQVLGADHPETLVTRTLIARQLIDKSEFEPALSEMRAVSALLAARFGEKNTRMIEALSDLADALLRVGHMSEAIDTGRRAYSLAIEVIGEGKPAAMNIGHQYAGLLYQAGRPGDALAIYQRILRTTRTLFDDENVDTIATLHNIAAVLSDLGRNEEAIEAYRYAAEVLAKTFPASHPSRLSVLNNLAQALRNAGLHDEALAVIVEVVRLRTDSLGAENQLTLISRSNHAAILAALGRYPEAIAAHREIYAIRKRRFGETHAETLRSLHNLAATLSEAEQNAEARELFAQVVALRTQHLGARNVDTVISMRGLAGVLVSAGDVEGARSLYHNIVDAAEALRAEGGLPDTLRRSFFSTITPAYKALAMLEARLGDFDAALKLAELSKARTLIETSSTRGTARNALSQLDRAALSDLEFRISVLDGRLPGVTDVALRADLEAQRNGLAAEFAALDGGLRARFPLYREATDFRLADAKDAAVLLADDEAILDFVHSGSELLLIWLDGKGRKGAVSLPAYANLPATLEAYRAALATPDGVAGLRYPAPGKPRRLVWKLSDGSYRLQSTDGGAIDDAKLVADIEDIRQDLSTWFLKALPAEVKDARRWHVSPDGPLASIPLDTLRATSGAFLIEEHDILAIQSLSLMALSRDRVKRYAELARLPILAIGDPEYTSPAPASEMARTGIGALRASSVGPAGQLAWSNLPGSAKELKGLATLFGLKASDDLFSGAAASERTVRRLQRDGVLQRHRYVLFSTHGYLDQRNPELSGIVLSQSPSRNS